MPLTVSGHVLDAELGDLALRLRYGFEDEKLLEASSPEDREAGARKWISVNGTEALLLADDASSVMGYSEFPKLNSETSRELVNEAIQALSSIWDAATARVNSDRSEHIPIAESLKRLNQIAREADPVGAWEKLMKDLLVHGQEMHGTVSGLRFESARGLPLPNHFHKVNVFLDFTPVGGEDPLDVAVIWRDAGDGTAALDVRLSNLPGSEAGDGSWNAVHTFDPARTKAIQRAVEWLAVLEHGAHEFVFGETFPVVQRVDEAARAGLSPGGDEVVWCRAEGVRRSAVAHLNHWVREVYP
ncbi:MAG: hypothetical protein JWO49_2110 [Arthrobacter sp.]|nr:hypothetical protein [Arthrobacter sp.]